MPAETNKFLLRLPASTAAGVRAFAAREGLSLNRVLTLAVQSFLGGAAGEQPEASAAHRSLLERVDQLTLAWQDAANKTEDLDRRLGKIEELATSQSAY